MRKKLTIINIWKIFILLFFALSLAITSLYAKEVRQWEIFEFSLKGPQNGNPFLDVKFSTEFRYKNRIVEPEGFYDGDGIYRVRFMPDKKGIWTYKTKSNCEELNGKTGEFTCISAAPGKHGPVRVRKIYHFAYADGTPYYPIGTTCYAWIHQGDELEEQTLATLKSSPFNKIRMCVFPKDYTFNKNEPQYYPFEKKSSEEWDFTRFNPEFFRHLEKRVGNLLQLGIEADIILFHPYDRWDFSRMDSESDDRYLHYIVARLSAYSNVWWSMANEYDLMREKTMADWNRFFCIIQENDTNRHMRSIHNCRGFYDHSKPWVTHCSIQHWDLQKARDWRDNYRKPVINDECQYEGNIENNWGNISARELVHRFWLGFVVGTYVGHGETYMHPDDILWWSKGGVLYGESAKRIAFLKDIIENSPAEGISPLGGRIGGREGEYYLYYLGLHQPVEKKFKLPEGNKYKVEIIDTWKMTITPVDGVFEGGFIINLPGKPNIAVRMQKIK